ncbi:hypothetical protein MJO57_30290 [Endozoicomonas sp. SCSIO W0465]|nr:hypothetical protein [Endozoicomonas sp. SCSIO W0465]USE36272.1 hypothetical protein MJO57_30290 [Endozoicomonas sp. SCSIO W0465]
MGINIFALISGYLTCTTADGHWEADSISTDVGFIRLILCGFASIGLSGL